MTMMMSRGNSCCSFISKFIIIGVLVISPICSINEARDLFFTAPRNKSIERTGKFRILELFRTTSINSNYCNTTTGLSGMCLNSQECIKKGGRGVESCGWGFGVCCVLLKSCGDTSSSNATYFVNSNYPSSTMGSEFCTLTINRPQEICQLRLDLEEFKTVGPDATTGQCSTDLFTVSGQDINDVVPIICGEATGQHMYVETGSTSGAVTLMLTTSRVTKERRWKIRVTQIPCNSPFRAPAHCFQYYTGPLGIIRSFNYVTNKESSEGGYPANMNYGICIRKEAGMCSATFVSEGEFGVNYGGSTCTSGSTGNLGDFISIGGTRYCGDNSTFRNSAVMARDSGPMVLTFASDSTHKTEDVGFNLRYTQSACSTGR